MKKYEYKFVRFPAQIGFDFEKKMKTLEEQWNAPRAGGLEILQGRQ